MAKRTRRQKQRAAARRTQPGRPQTAPVPARAWDLPGSATATQTAAEDADPALDDVAGAAEAASDTAADTPATAPRRRIERLSQAAQPARTLRGGRGPANAAAMFQPLESEDAAIPFDRVPYVPADLRRVAIIAALMIVLIVIAAIVVSNVVK